MFGKVLTTKFGWVLPVETVFSILLGMVDGVFGGSFLIWPLTEHPKGNKQDFNSLQNSSQYQTEPYLIH